MDCPGKEEKNIIQMKFLFCKKQGKDIVWNKKVKNTLPEPIAYCGNTSTDSGIVYVGGENENGISDKAFY